jgi:hypothetical protein
MPKFPWTEQRRQFDGETTKHELTVIREDGLYRHLRAQAPGTRMWSWDIITWPGYLTIVGDVGNGWTFSRTDDMLSFFHPSPEPYRIDADYWWEKMPSQLRDAAKVFDADVLLEHGRETLSEWDLDQAQVAAATSGLEDAWRSVYFETESDYRRVLDEFEFTGDDGFTHRFSDTWEWSSKTYDWHFILALLAIVWTVEKYNERAAAAAAPKEIAA